MTTFAEILNAALALPPGQRDELAALLRESATTDEPRGFYRHLRRLATGNRPPLSGDRRRHGQLRHV